MDKLKDFITGVGVLCETWMIVYKTFTEEGMDTKEAMMHTREFMTAFITSTLQTNGGKDGTSE